MVYKRQRMRARMPRKKRAYRKRTMRTARRRNNISRRVVVVRKQRLMAQITGGGIADLFYSGAYNTAFDLNNAAWDLAALQQQFEFIKAQKFIVSLEPLQNQSSSAVPNAYIRRVVDNQTGFAYTTEAQYLANADCKSHSVQSPRTITFVVYPKSYRSQTLGGVTTFAPRSPGYVNADAAQLPSLIAPHVFIPAGTAGVGMFNVRITAIVCFKGNK